MEEIYVFNFENSNINFAKIRWPSVPIMIITNMYNLKN